jgi:hypothetical protein
VVAAIDQQAIDWLLSCDEPAIRGMARRDLLGEAAPPDLSRVTDGPIFRALLAGQQPDGGFGVHPYRKWTGAHWRLVSLVELEAPAGEPHVMAALETVLDWIADPRYHGTSRRRSDGVILSDASMEGNALAVACRLGRADDPRADRLAQWLIEWQWPDGGWNCDARASGRRSSFHETHVPMWALFEFAQATSNDAAREAADRAAELFLSHRIFRRHGSREPIHPEWVKLHYPPYWHYDVGQALHLLARMGRVRDERASEALDILERRRLPDGRWQASPRWWQPPGSPRSPEAVDWGRDEPSRMMTLNALRILRAAGRA